jgi:hypothetical protein
VKPRKQRPFTPRDAERVMFDERPGSAAAARERMIERMNGSKHESSEVARGKMLERQRKR